jgi:hypothetical protein
LADLNSEFLMRAMMVVAVLLLGMSSSPVTAQGPVDSSTRAELERARDLVWRSWFAGDSQTLDRVLAGALAAGDDKDGWSDRKQAISDSREFAKSGGKLLDLRFDSTAIQLHGTLAVMTARYTYTTADGAGKKNTTRGYAVEIFVKEKGVWTHPFWHLASQGS